MCVMDQKTIEQELLRVVHSHEHGAIIMAELPEENYLDATSASVKTLLDDGFEGVYISFQRPFDNLKSIFLRKDIDINKLLVIDVASALAKQSKVLHDRCIHIDNKLDINELVRAIYISLPKLISIKKFVFIDSISTISLHKPLSETLRFSEFLIRTIKKTPLSGSTFLIFNVASGLSQKKFIRDIALRVEETIRE